MCNCPAQWHDPKRTLLDAPAGVPGASATTFGSNLGMVSCPSGYYITSLAARVDTRATTNGSTLVTDLLGVMTLNASCYSTRLALRSNFTAGEDFNAFGLSVNPGVGTWCALQPALQLGLRPPPMLR
jgi:hypothetical protein